VKGYSTREVSEALGFPTSTILAWARGGLVTPTRGPRGAYVFSFQDLAVLRAARELLDAELPARRVREALERLREQMPAGRPLSAVRLEALGRQVLVRDRDAVWEPTTGQLQLDLDRPPPRHERVPASESTGVNVVMFPVAGRTRGTLATPASEPSSAEEWFDRAMGLEGACPLEAARAYHRALELDPALAEAHVNLGRLLHEGGTVREAEDHYRAAIQADPGSARAHYNLGVALEDQGRTAEAVDAYRAALGHDDGLAVAHFNLSRLCEAAGQTAEALAHLSSYKRLLDRGGTGA